VRGGSKTRFEPINSDTGKMVLFFRNTFLNFETAIFVISIFDLIILVTINKEILKFFFRNPVGGYRGQKPGSDFKENEYARFVAHINVVMPM
jgi:hypothetical protein